MKNIEINIGNACNNECKFCMIDFEINQNFIDFAAIKKEILIARQRGFESIGFLGGEFTLHSEVFKIIKLSKILGFKIIHIISNGRKYKDSKFLEQLIKNGVNRFSVSIHSHDEKIEDGLTKRSGGFAEKIAGLKNLIKCSQKGLIKYPLVINLVINAYNYQEIIKTLKFFNQLGISEFRLNYIWLHGRARKNKDLFLQYSNFLPQVDSIINLAKKNNFQVAFEGIPLCLIKNKDALDYSGELRDLDTEVVAFNNPQQKREHFNWQERKKNEFKIKHDKCLACQYDNICEGVWRDYIDLYGWQEFNF